ALYREALASIPGITLLGFDSVERNSHHYVVVEVDERCAASRDEIIAALHAENVLARKYFWPGCHKMQPYSDLQPYAQMMLPRTEEVSQRVIVLPSGQSVTQDDIVCIGEIIACASSR
ncbi:DegT/DnrJ/EryC1/StrS family aminotransferase, partial [Staphylococcus aureus]|uniref:DegT/DnrJ/EryC1/StrS family aminotransferase n=1 Tax=Staphylococcus aureus TaxID=1280 RepID=UPI0039BDD43B